MSTTRGQGADAPETTRKEQVESITRTVIAGHEQGAVRRIILYVSMFLTLSVGFWLPPVLVASMVCGILLLATDDLL